ncbi:hypothetical protein BGZ49_007481 [Haplosporangium sp. Z 27]|nr:hypothetical protein BGZ49_007481 [Haplosporangium sp. Z 27]
MSLAILYKANLFLQKALESEMVMIRSQLMKTAMPIASMTEAFAAAAIGELVAEGKMDWDTTSVSKYYTTSYLSTPYMKGYPQVDFGWFYNTKDSRIDLIECLKYVDSNLSCAQTIYNNLMYGVAGVTDDNVDGTYEEAVRRRIFKPLGLSNTGFWSVR